MMIYLQENTRIKISDDVSWFRCEVVNISDLKTFVVVKCFNFFSVRFTEVVELRLEVEGVDFSLLLIQRLSRVDAGHDAARDHERLSQNAHARIRDRVSELVQQQWHDAGARDVPHPH